MMTGFDPAQREQERKPTPLREGEVRHLVLDTASALPPEWDRLAEANVFLRREALAVFERTNPCAQQYHLFYLPAGPQSGLDSIFVAYRLKLDILTYSMVGLRLPVTVVGVPCSVSKAGYVLGERTREAVFAAFAQWRGAKLILNADDEWSIPRLTAGTTLPTCRLRVEWQSFEEYFSALRSHYRYRVTKALRRWKDIETTELADNREFDPALYQLYLQVYQRSEFKLERLPCEFFQTFPARIIKFCRAGRPIGFVQLVEYGKELNFLLGGFDYAENHRYDIYLNLLLEILRQGIAGGFTGIDFGQTAEDTKLKLGAQAVRKRMYFGHANALVNGIVRSFPGLLSYREKDLQFHVFRS